MTKSKLFSFLIFFVMFELFAYSSHAGNLLVDILNELNNQQKPTGNISNEGYQKELNNQQRPAGNIPNEGYQAVPFFKVVQIGFQKDLLGKQLKTTALFQKMEQAPRSGPGVAGWINLRLCDPKQTSICDDLFLLRNEASDSAYALDENEKIDIFGTIQPKPKFFGGHFRIEKIERQNKKGS